MDVSNVIDCFLGMAALGLLTYVALTISTPKRLIDWGIRLIAYGESRQAQATAYRQSAMALRIAVEPDSENDRYTHCNNCGSDLSGCVCSLEEDWLSRILTAFGPRFGRL